MGKASEIQANLQSAYTQSEALKTKRNSIDGNMESVVDLGGNINSGLANGIDSSKTMNGQENTV